MEWADKIVAVTGAAGFIGSHLCRALVTKGAKVLALDNFEIGSRANLEPVLSGIQILNCDVRKKSELAVLERSEVVFHLAAIANPRTCLDDFCRAYEVNVEGTKNVLQACPSGCRVIFLSGAIVYGVPLRLPLDEDHPLRARDPYSLTKIMGECLCWAYMPGRKLRPTVVRNFTTYGPGQSGDYVVPSLLGQGIKNRKIEVWNDKPSRDFTYVQDTVDGLVGIAASPKLVGEVVNLGSGVETSIGVLASCISQILGNIPVVNLDKDVVAGTRQSCDNRKLREATGWRPAIPLQLGLRKTVEWIRGSLDSVN